MRAIQNACRRQKGDNSIWSNSREKRNRPNNKKVSGREKVYIKQWIADLQVQLFYD